MLVNLTLYDIRNKKDYFPYIVAIIGFMLHEAAYHWVLLEIFDELKFLEQKEYL